MAKLITVVAMVVGGIWFANTAIDSITASHAAHAERVASRTQNIRGL